jgi:hypothetical protein
MSSDFRHTGDGRINAGQIGAIQAVGRLPLLFGFLGGPIFWSLHLLIMQVLVASACSTGSQGFYHFTIGGVAGWEIILLLVTFLLILLTLAAGLTAFRAWRRSHVGLGVTGAAGGALGRSGWLALAGVLLSTLFLLGIVAAGVPIFWLSGCGG